MEDSVFSLIDSKSYDELNTGLKNDSLTRINMAGIPPLVYAAQKKDLSALRILLKYEDVDSVDQENKTALHHAVEGNQTLAVKFLLDNGASTQIKDVFGKRPADYVQSDCGMLLLDLLNKAEN